MSRRPLDERLSKYPVLERLIQQLVEKVEKRDWASAIHAIYKLNLYVYYANERKSNDK